MKKITMMAAIAAAMAATAQPVTPETGVANDHTGTAGGATGVVFVPRTAETGYGYDDGVTVIGFTFLPWAAPNSSWDVTGVRSASGLFVNVFGNYTASGAAGWQTGLVNVVGDQMRGLQVGLVNYAERLSGVQIGLLNFARSQHFFPIINIAW